MDEQGGDAGTGLSRTSSRYEIATNRSDEPQPKNISHVDNGFTQSAGSTSATAAYRAEGVVDIGSRAFTSDIATLTVPGPFELPVIQVSLATTVPDHVDPDDTSITESQKLEHTPLKVPDAPSTKWKGLKQFARVLEPVSNLFGPIKETVDLFTECVDKCEMTGVAKVEYEELRVRLEGIFDDLNGFFVKENSLTMTSSMENLCSPIMKHYMQFTHGPVEAEGPALDHRQLAHLATWVFEDAIGAMTISPDGRHLALGIGKNVLVIDSSSGHRVLGPLHGHSEDISAIMFSPDCTRVVAGSLDYKSKTVTIIGWDTRTGDIVVGPLPLDGPTSSISCLTFWPDYTCIASGSHERTVCIWDATTGKMLHSLETDTLVRAVAFSPDGSLIAAGLGEALQVWNTQTGVTTLDSPITGRVDVIAFSHDSSRIIHANGSRDTISVWNAQDGQLIHELDVGIRIRAGTVIGYSPDNRHIALCNYRSVYLWDVRIGKMVLGPLEGHTNSGFITSIVFSPDGSRIISACSGGTVCTWDAQQRSFAPKSISDRTIIVWDAYTGSKLLDPLVGHSDEVESVHFAPDSTRLVSGSSDTTICIWDVQTQEMLFDLPNGHKHLITSVAYSPDGTRILSCSEDGSVRIHDAQSANDRALLRSTPDFGDWVMSKDGWIVDDQSGLLVWIPADLRRALMWPRTQVAVAAWGYVGVKFDKSRMGESWAQSYT
ncbi:WD40 domain protein, putative, partial [Rhizoctonia solani AG-3 Rhs1AP]